MQYSAVKVNNLQPPAIFPPQTEKSGYQGYHSMDTDQKAEDHDEI